MQGLGKGGLVQERTEGEARVLAGLDLLPNLRGKTAVAMDTEPEGRAATAAVGAENVDDHEEPFCRRFLEVVGHIGPASLSAPRDPAIIPDPAGLFKARASRTR